MTAKPASPLMPPSAAHFEVPALQAAHAIQELQMENAALES
jgi:hypothetical protein